MEFRFYTVSAPAPPPMNFNVDFNRLKQVPKPPIISSNHKFESFSREQCLNGSQLKFISDMRNCMTQNPLGLDENTNRCIMNVTEQKNSRNNNCKKIIHLKNSMYYDKGSKDYIPKNVPQGFNPNVPQVTHNATSKHIPIERPNPFSYTPTQCWKYRDDCGRYYEANTDDHLFDYTNKPNKYTTNTTLEDGEHYTGCTSWPFVHVQNHTITHYSDFNGITFDRKVGIFRLMDR